MTHIFDNLPTTFLRTRLKNSITLRHLAEEPILLIGFKDHKEYINGERVNYGFKLRLIYRSYPDSASIEKKNEQIVFDEMILWLTNDGIFEHKEMVRGSKPGIKLNVTLGNNNKEERSYLQNALTKLNKERDRGQDENKIPNEFNIKHFVLNQWLNLFKSFIKNREVIGVDLTREIKLEQALLFFRYEELQQDYDELKNRLSSPVVKTRTENPDQTLSEKSSSVSKTGKHPATRLKLSKKENIILNNKIYDKIDRLIEHNKMTFLSACTDLAKRSKVALGYELTDKSIEGRYNRHPETIKRRSTKKGND